MASSRRSAGLMNPNHFLAAAIAYLFTNRPGWGDACGVGKTMVSSGIIDRTAHKIGRKVVEVPVGFKWFVDGLTDGSLGFGGEESAGASFLRRDGSAWTTDKDGLIMGPAGGRNYRAHRPGSGTAVWQAHGRIGCAVLRAHRRASFGGATQDIESRVAGRNHHGGIGGRGGGGETDRSARQWRCVRRHQGGSRKTAGLPRAPSGTEDVYKIYAESFKSQAHLHQIQQEAQTAISKLFAAS